jgi:ubiquinone/menaquinone biosynthesis C-methylase UbiE
VAEVLKKTYNISSKSAVLDIGCAKGFLLYDLRELTHCDVKGMDISSYAISHALEGFGDYQSKRVPNLNSDQSQGLERLARDELLPNMIIGSADRLPWADNSFDLVLSINTAHNLCLLSCTDSIKEMIRVCKDKKSMFIQLDAFRNDSERSTMENWNLTAKTILSVEEWLHLFKQIDYKGDYFWTTFKA